MAGRRVGHTRRYGLGRRDIRSFTGGLSRAGPGVVSRRRRNSRCVDGPADDGRDRPPGMAGQADPRRGRRTTVVTAHLAWLAMLIAGAVGATVTSRRQRALVR